MKKERVRSKHGFKGFGTFILGWFIGFMSTLLIIAGVGYWAYSSVSVKKIEKWTKTDITSNKGVEALTLKKVFNIAQGIASSGGDAYTIAKMEEDFGVKLLNDSIYGISLDILKNSPIKDIKHAIDDTVDTVTFNNVLNFLNTEEDLGLLNTVLDSEIKYYVNGNKLYTDSEYNTEVAFNYTIDGTKVEFANGTYTVSAGVVTTSLRHIPLQTAMASMEEVTQGLKIYEVMGYYYNQTEDKYYENYNSSSNTYSNELTGIMGSLAGFSVGDLSNNETFNDLYVYEMMGYYYNDDDQKYYQNYDSTTDTYSNEVGGVLKHLVSSTLENLTTTINSLTLGKALDVDEASATGVIKTFYNTPINELESKIQNIKIYEAMGYYHNQDDGKYYENYDSSTNTYSTQVTGMIATLAPYSVTDLSNSDTFDNLYIYEMMGYTRLGNETDGYTYKDGETDVAGVMSMLAGTQLKNIESQINTIINETTLNVLFEKGVIDGTNISDNTKTIIGGMTVPELMEYVDQMLTPIS